MTTFAVTDPNHTLGAINYLLSNLNATAGTGNVTLPGNVLVANTTTGVVSQYGNVADVSYYLYEFINLRYSNNSTGGGGSFSTVPTNANYFGVFNSTSSAPSANPTDYQWYQVAGGFGTTKYLFYSAIGGRQIAWAAANAAPSSNYVQSVANVAIDLDVVTTAAGTPGERGPIAMAYVITTADPTTATPSQLTAWFSAPRDAVTPPIGTGLTPVVGDTALFTYVNGTTNPSVCYTYNGSIWVPVDSQVVSGNVLVDGTVAANAIIAGSITSTQIAADSITGNRIAGNTITSTNIQTGTITANNIAGNTITATQIQTGTLTTNLFTANTINGNIMTAGSITADKLAANAITANTVVSTGAILNNNASLGFWLDGPSGNARFGNNISIGGNLTVSGLINNSGLVANSVNTTQVASSGISAGLVSNLSGPSFTGNALPWNQDVFANAQGQLTAVSNQTGLFVYPNITFRAYGNITAGTSGGTQYVATFIKVYNGSTLVTSEGLNTYIPITVPSNWEIVFTPQFGAVFIPNYAGALIRIAVFFNVTGPTANRIYVLNAGFGTIDNPTNLVLQSLKR